MSKSDHPESKRDSAASLAASGAALSKSQSKTEGSTALAVQQGDAVSTKKKKPWYEKIRIGIRLGLGRLFGKQDEEDDDDGSASRAPYRDIADTLQGDEAAHTVNHAEKLAATYHSPLGDNVQPTLTEIALGYGDAEPGFVATMLENQKIVSLAERRAEKILNGSEPVATQTAINKAVPKVAEHEGPEPDPDPTPRNTPTTPRLTR